VYERPPSQEELEAAKAAGRIARARKLPIVVCSLLAFGFGVYGVQLYISLTRTPQLTDLPDDLGDRFDNDAEGWDEKVNTAERMLRLTSLRKSLMQRTRGHVLEVAVGTGRNIPFYPTSKCDTVTLLDKSLPMLQVAKKKWKDEHPEYFRRVFFKNQSALDPITPPYGAQDGYDTVVQTMAICSTPEPEKLLRNLESVTKEEGGQILLLEHGKSHYQWINNLLDKTASAHANEHGCWWNKDIGKVVEESGLEVVEIKRYNFGTTWWVELRPRKGKGRSSILKAIEQKKEQVSVPLDAPVQRPWWSLWR
jgi:methyltransferase OMS1